MKYRADIDGLRAVAIIPVVLFHAGLPGVDGGFVGVDVFFVISGYLITSIIRNDLEAGRFSLLHFYERRIRRILPVLFAVLLASTISAVALMMPEDLLYFGRSLTAAALFVSNMQFWSEADYFDAPALSKPLLHTWSLAIEEQFYILIPPALIVLVRFKSRALVIAALALGVLASLAISIWAVANAPRAGFYLLPTRAWELLLGSLLAYRALPPIRSGAVASGLGLVGLIAIVASVLFYDERTPFPGLAAVPPTLGALVILYSGQERATPVSHLLASAPMRFVGVISYSLYMWHWPLIVFARYWAITPLGLVWSLGLIAASFVLAVLSWRYIERPFRAPQGVKLGRPALLGTVAAATAVTVAGGFTVSIDDGLPGRVKPAALAILEREQYDDPLRSCHQAFEKRLRAETLCVRGAPGVAPSFVLVGDSHAGAIAHGVFEAARLEGVSGYQLSDAGYRPVAPLMNRGEEAKYRYMNEVFGDLLERHPELTTLVVVVYWRQAVGDAYVTTAGGPGQDVAPAFQAIMRRYPDRRFVFVEPAPRSTTFGANPAARAAHYGRDFDPVIQRAEFTEMQDAYRDILVAVAGEPNGLLIKTSEVFCDERVCRGRIGDQLAYRDDNHPSEAAALEMAPILRAAFSSAPADYAQAPCRECE